MRLISKWYIRIFYNIWLFVDIAGILINRTNNELIKDYAYCFIALFDVSLSVNITFSYAGENLFLINTQSTLFKNTAL